MKRHASLHPLSEHHHHALVRALQIRRASEEAGEQQRRQRLEEEGREFIRFYREMGWRHFEEEEEVLLPAYGLYVSLDRDPVVQRILAEHAELRERVADLEQALATDAPWEEKVIALGRLLQGHIRLEEDEFFPRVEAALGEEGLSALSGRLSRLHAG